MIGQPCVGGPLDGQRVMHADLYPRRIAGRDIPHLGVTEGDVLSEGGAYHMHSEDYLAYNRADAYRDRPKAIWLHRSLLP